MDEQVYRFKLWATHLPCKIYNNLLILMMFPLWLSLNNIRFLINCSDLFIILLQNTLFLYSSLSPEIIRAIFFFLSFRLTSDILLFIIKLSSWPEHLNRFTLLIYPGHAGLTEPSSVFGTQRSSVCLWERISPPLDFLPLPEEPPRRALCHILTRKDDYGKITLDPITSQLPLMDKEVGGTRTKNESQEEDQGGEAIMSWCERDKRGCCGSGNCIDR